MHLRYVPKNGEVRDKGARGFQYNSYQRLNQIEEMDRIGQLR